MNRRDALLSIAGTVGAAGIVRSEAVTKTKTMATPAVPAKPALGLQLYTVWPQLEEDFPGTLRAVAAAGYKYVETLGAFGRDPVRLRAMLDAAGLEARAQHVMPADLYPSSRAARLGQITIPEVLRRINASMPMDRMGIIVEEGISRARVLGQKYVLWHVTTYEEMESTRALDAYCRALNSAGQQCAAEGMHLAIHNHDSELKTINGLTPYNVMIENTDPDLVCFELDLCWTVSAGQDPVKYLTKYPNRFRLLHLKDFRPFRGVVDPGTGIVNFDAILPVARAANVDSYIVEYDRPADPLATIRSCYDFFSARL